ncbi:LOW QUALITY PROTEIN: hypothetical protein MXB_1243, partial [Myxobolus squamalis]
MLIELESLLSTRRFFNVLLDDHHVIVKLRLCDLYTSSQDKVFRELWEILKFYSKIEIDDLKGVELNHNQLLQRHYDELTRLQKIAFLEFKNEMSDFFLAPVYRIDSRDSLIKYFSNLSDPNLHLFAHHCNIVNHVPGKKLSRDFLIELLTFKYEKTCTLLNTINKLPLYPDEQLLWHKPIIPEEDWSGENCLPLPKLNLQFLTLNDYLWRNFTLFILESTYSIKIDIEDAVTRLKPWMNELGVTEFAGWARMALPLKEFSITSVGSTDVSTSNPLFVHADLTISTRMRESFKSEWLGLRRHDPVFLIYIEYENVGTIFSKSDQFFPSKFQYGIISVRGAEVVGMMDEDGNVLNEGSEYKRKDNQCSYRIALDPNQYLNFNVIIRRKPKENNFKAVLETIRSLMNTECLIPDWLGDIFLGYGDPTSAHYSNLSQETNLIDFHDTFLDGNHLVESFPGYNVELSSDHHSRFWKLLFNDNKSIIATPYFKTYPLLEHRVEVKTNLIRFTPRQIEAIRGGIQNGLTMIVGPPGTGKTDVAVQIISTLFKTHPTQRTLIVTHSNQALNQIFEKIINLDVDEMKLIRLGHGEEELATTKDFS